MTDVLLMGGREVVYRRREGGRERERELPF